jgi:hypothetical protein
MTPTRCRHAAGLDQPFGVMVSREFPLDDPGLAAFLAKLRGTPPELFVLP